MEEKQVDFYGDEITAALVEVVPGQETQVYVPIRPICDYLGLSWAGQRERILRDEVLTEEFKGVRVTRTPSAGKRSTGGVQEALSLPLKLLPGWLFGIDPSRVKPELKEKIIRYRRECYRVLSQVFQAETAAVTELDEVDLFSQDISPNPPNPVLVQIREQALAMARFAEQQIQAEQRLNAHDQMFEQVKDAFRHIRQRMDAVERVVRPGDIISDTQAAEISIKVRGLAEYLTSKLGPIDSAGKVHYQSIFGELQRRFGVTSYKLIPQRDYTEVLAFLNDWRKAADN